MSCAFLGIGPRERPCRPTDRSLVVVNAQVVARCVVRGPAGMPAAVSLEFTSMSWTSDGRLVLTAEAR
jgi:hypothetical protein